MVLEQLVTAVILQNVWLSTIDSMTLLMYSPNCRRLSQFLEPACSEIKAIAEQQHISHNLDVLSHTRPIKYQESTDWDQRWS